VQPRRFFSLIADRLLGPGNGFVATALLDDEPVASGLYLSHNGVLVAKFGASDPQKRDCGAGYLIDWEVMTAACDEGYRLLDFGRTDPGADGLRLYKAGWGALEEPLVYTHISQSAPAPDRRRSERLQRWLISRSPLWVCRATGEILYRWAA
jgi:CelD/BcsL family acetyltransferase involved in cellulose biosynthesis